MCFQGKREIVCEIFPMRGAVTLLTRQDFHGWNMAPSSPLPCRKPKTHRPLSGSPRPLKVVSLWYPLFYFHLCWSCSSFRRTEPNLEERKGERERGKKITGLVSVEVLRRLQWVSAPCEHSPVVGGTICGLMSYVFH